MLALSLHTIVAAIALASELARTNAQPNFHPPNAKRAASPLINHPNLGSLPNKPAANQKVASVIDTNNIQGDILVGMQKATEQFFFFNIANVSDFKQKLGSVIHPLVTSTSQLQDKDNVPENVLNIAFSQAGLTALNVTGQLSDQDFTDGHVKRAPGDFKDDTSKWVAGLDGKGDPIHGVMLLAAATNDSINTQLESIMNGVGSSMKEVYRLSAAARPGDNAGHEHFGYLDGIAQPLIKDFSPAHPGSDVVDPGQILVGETGDSKLSSRPSWAKDGSFLVFRQLQQFVPELHKFASDNAITEPGLSQEEGALLFEARMIGRWRSGAPVDLSPLRDNKTLADFNVNNNFTFNHPEASGFNLQTNVSFCPFSAHIRKTVPRADLGGPQKKNIMRAGIPYGPEVSDSETSSGKSDPSLERGLAFVAYQSSIASGFKFLQQTWVNNANFVHSATGLDPIIGTAGPNQSFNVAGLNPTKPTDSVTVQSDFVVSRGGEYFFSPSISSIKDTLAA